MKKTLILIIGLFVCVSIHSQTHPTADNGCMILDQPGKPLARKIPATVPGRMYRMSFKVDLVGCDSLLAGALLPQGSTQWFYSSGEHRFFFTANDTLSLVFFYINTPCRVRIGYVKVEEVRIESRIVCTEDSAGYRYGFNGKEKIDEQYGIEGTAYDFGARLYDSRLGRWMARDPLEKEYPGQSTYSAFNNNPLYFVDPTGEGGKPALKTNRNGEYYIEISSTVYLYTDDKNVNLVTYAAYYKEQVECDLNPYGTFVDNLNHLPTAKMIVPKDHIINGKKSGSTANIPVIHKVDVKIINGGPEEAVKKANGNTDKSVNFYYVYDGPTDNAGDNFAWGGNSGVLNQNAPGMVPAHERIHDYFAKYDETPGSHSTNKESMMYLYEGPPNEEGPTLRYNPGGTLLQEDLHRINGGAPLRNGQPFGLPAGNAIYDNNSMNTNFEPISGKNALYQNEK